MVRVGGPQVQSGLGVVDRPARLGERPSQQRTPGRVPLPLRDGVRVIGQRRRHRRLHRSRHDHPGLPPDRQQPRDQRRVAGHEPGPVAGQVRPLGQRMDGQHARVRPVAHVRVQHGDGRDLPAQAEVALVGGHHRPAFGRPGHHLAQVPGREHPPGRVRRRVQPHQLDPGGPGRQQAVRGDGGGPGQPRAGVVGRVGQRRVHQHVTGPEPEHDGQPGDELLGPDDRQHVVRRHPDPVGAFQPARRRFTESRSAPGQRVTRRVGSLGQGGADHGGHRVHRRAHGQVHRAVRVQPGLVT